MENAWKALEKHIASKDLMIDKEEHRGKCILLRPDDFRDLKDFGFKKFLEDQCGTLFCPVACYYLAFKKGFPHSPLDPGGLTDVACDTLFRIGLREHYEKHLKDKIGTSYADIRERMHRLFGSAVVEEARLRRIFEIKESSLEGEKNGPSTNR